MPTRTFCSIVGLAVLLSTQAVVQGHDSIRVEFTTSDGIAIVGDYWTPLDMSKPAPAVILLHMYKSNRSAWLPLVVALEKAGFAIMIFDLRGHGESTKPQDHLLEKKVADRDPALFKAMHRDVFGAYRWLQDRPEVDLSRVALVGASVGCSVALDYAGRDKSIDVVALMTPGEKYLGLDSIEHIKKYGQRPVLMLSSEEERSVGTDKLSALVSNAEVKILPQTKIHGTRMFGQVKGVEKQIAAYLQAHVGSPSTAVVYASVDGTVFHEKASSSLQQIKRDNLRLFSSAAEAEQRGLKPAKN